MLFLALGSPVIAQLSLEDEKFVQDYLESNKIPGISIAIVEDYQIQYAKGLLAASTTIFGCQPG